MGSHRADTRAPSARRPAAQETPAHLLSDEQVRPSAPTSQPGKRAAHQSARQESKGHEPTRTVEKLAVARRRTPVGKRSAPRKSLFRGLPSAPIVLGVAALAGSAGGGGRGAHPHPGGGPGGPPPPQDNQTNAGPG